MIQISPLVKCIDDPAYWPIQFKGGPWDGDFFSGLNGEYAELPIDISVGPTLGIPERCHYKLAKVIYRGSDLEYICYMYMRNLKIQPECVEWLRESRYMQTGRLVSIPSRDDWGRMVREIWIRWARHQPHCKPTWLTPYEDLSEADKEVDRRIGVGIAHAAVAISRRFLSAFKHDY
jgi:hypothetical protein